MTHDINLEDIPLEIKQEVNKRTRRFLPNPEKNWGPKAAAVIKREKNNKHDEIAGEMHKRVEQRSLSQESNNSDDGNPNKNNENSGVKKKVQKDHDKNSSNSKSKIQNDKKE